MRKTRRTAPSFRTRFPHLRELAHNLAQWNPNYRTLRAAPAWARHELDDHLADPRPAIYSDEDLEQGKTGNTLWNACQ